MVFLFAHHNSLNLPVEYDDGNQHNQYNNNMSTRESISVQRQLKELTAESKEFLISLGLRLKKKQN